MKRPAFLLYLFAICLSSGTLLAQNYVYATGNPTFGVNIPVENGFINVTNGNLHFEFPLATHKQRGALNLNERLVYDSRIWQIVHYSGYYWWPLNVPNSSAGWRFVTGAETGTVGNVQTQNTLTCDPTGPHGPYPTEVDSYTVYNWTDPSGTLHTFNAVWNSVRSPCPEDGPSQPQSVSGWATDASGYQIALSGDTRHSPTSIKISDNNGQQVYPQVIDRFGNFWTKDSNGNLVDDLGRTPVIATVNGNTTYYDVLAPNGPISNNGTRVRYTVTTSQIPISTSFQQSGVTEYQNNGGNPPPTIAAIQSIALPNGSSYTFTYDGYGEIQTVKLPTGGVVTYGWSNYLDSYQNKNRWLASRTLGSNPSMQFTPKVISQCAANGTGCQEQVTLHQPSGDESVYQLTLNNGAWNTNTTVYTGSASGGKAVTQTANTYDFSHACSTVCTGAEYVTKTYAITTLPDVGLLSQEQSIYSNPQTGKVNAVKDWDYYSGSPSAKPTRETDYTYTATGYDTQQVTVLDSGGSKAAQTVYGYTTSATSVLGILGHGSANAGGPYLKTVSNWLNTGGTLITTYTMDNTGQVRSIADPKGNPPANFTYQCQDAFPFQSSNPLNQTTTYGYDCNSGAVTSVRDPNDTAASRAGTTYAYEGVGGRVQSITYPDAGKTSYTYPSSNEVDSLTTATPDPSISSQMLVDVYGRKSQSVQAGVSSETSYDSNGRLSCITNSHLVGSATDGSTCITIYDGLSRPRVQTQQDGSTVQWSYTGNVTTFTDEAQHSWARTSDAFGSLIKVVEPNGASTSYTYDGLHNLRTASQNGLKGDTPRMRTSIYDSLSRLTSACDPEAILSGSVCSTTGPWSATYGYDANGNLSSRTDARGLAITYKYDALNRVITEQAPSVINVAPAINNVFSYDVGGTNLGGTTFSSSNAIGRLTQASNSINASEEYSYDPLGRVIWEEYVLPTNCCASATYPSISAVYDLAGNVTSLIYPDGRHVSQSWNSAGQLSKVNYVDWNGQAVNYPYVPTISYFPSGAPFQITLGNGVIETRHQNNRLQLTEISDHGAGNVNQLLFDKQYCYGPSTSTCPSLGSGKNNSNIWQVTDALNALQTQGFSYDALNRLSAFSNGSGSMQQSYLIDSFGNLSQNGGTLQSNLSFNSNNQIIAGGFGYDAAGNVLSINNGVSTTNYGYDAAGRLSEAANINLIYDATGDRIALDEPGKDADVITNYLRFNGQVLAKQTSGGWSDYVFANGQRIARADSFDQRIHLLGTTSVIGSTAGSYLSFSNYVVQSGDKLYWRQFQAGAVGGTGITFSDNTTTSGIAVDLGGNSMNSDPTQNIWEQRVVDLTAFAGKTAVSFWVVADTQTPVGSWNSYFNDISIVGKNGTVTPIYNRDLNASVIGYFQSRTITNLASYNEISNLTSDSVQPLNTTTYYHGDQIGSVRMTTSAGGWPTSNDTFYPFGQELNQSFGQVGYRFGGLERDTRNGLDYATFRQYASAQGRWMSPDPYSGSVDLAHPQSLNRYSYVSNMPLGYRDPTGLFGEEILTIVGQGTSLCLDICAWAGPVGWAVAGVSGVLELTHLLGLWGHPQFHGSLKPRPSNVNCNSKLPNGQTVGDVVRQQRALLQNVANDATATAQTGTPSNPLGEVTGAFYPIAQSNGPIDFKNSFSGQANGVFLGQAGNFAYYATGSGILPNVELDAGAAGYGLYSAALGRKAFSSLTGPMFSDASAAATRDAGLAANGCPQ